MPNPVDPPSLDVPQYAKMPVVPEYAKMPAVTRRRRGLRLPVTGAAPKIIYIVRRVVIWAMIGSAIFGGKYIQHVPHFLRHIVPF
jgi:hypothetical protein